MSHKIGDGGSRLLMPLAPLALLVAVTTMAASVTTGVPSDTGSRATVTATSLTVNAAKTLGRVNPAVLGHSYLWQLNGEQSYNPRSDKFYPAFLEQLRTVIEPGSLRYPGGISAQTFHWERAVGPQASRMPNAYGPVQGPSPSRVGPDEFGELLDATGAIGVVTVNFGSGTAAEAGAFVAYMTGRVGTSKWADLRAENGHPKPYDVPYWEVGNEEEYNDELYWRQGARVEEGGPKRACVVVVTCEYVYGGTTRLVRQRVVGFADWRPIASYSNGLAGQVKYVESPPMKPETVTVYVGGKAWTDVPSLASAGPTAHVYSFVPSSGRIMFGNGVQGAIPADHQYISATYISGPHDGFLQFYKAMKAANPSIHVCAADLRISFLRSMGSGVPYDCLDFHPYVIAQALPDNVPIGTYQNEIMAYPDQQSDEIATWERRTALYAHRRVPLVLTEYGQLVQSTPYGSPYFHDSLDEALLDASQVVDWIRLGTSLADRQVLTGPSPPPTPNTNPGSGRWVVTAAIGTPGPDTVLEPAGLVYHLVASLSGGTIVPVTTRRDPLLTKVDGRAVPALEVVAVRFPGRVELLAINRSTQSPVQVGVMVRGVVTEKSAAFSELDGPSSLSYNTTAAPSTVSLTSGNLAVTAGQLALAVPAHSVMLIQLPTLTTS